MKTLISIALSVLVLLQSFGIHMDDMVQIDEFIEHAQFHSEQYGDNVFVFISKHYGELKAAHEKEHQEEKQDHENLPFNGHSQLSLVSAFVVGSFSSELNQLEILEFKSLNFHYQAPSSSLHSEGILQPPRIS